MKLSNIKGEKVLDMIADLIDPICAIAQTDIAKEVFNKEKPPKGMSAREYALVKFRRCIPQLLRVNKTEIITVLAIVSEMTPEEYAAQMTPVQLVKDITELLNDDDFKELFYSAQQEAPKPSGAAPETTTAAND